MFYTSLGETVILWRKSLMATHHQFTAIIEREGDGYVSHCPDVDVASQGATIEEARANLSEAVEMFLEVATEKEIRERLHSEVYVTRLAPDPSRNQRASDGPPGLAPDDLLDPVEVGIIREQLCAPTRPHRRHNHRVAKIQRRLGEEIERLKHDLTVVYLQPR